MGDSAMNSNLFFATCLAMSLLAPIDAALAQIKSAPSRPSATISYVREIQPLFRTACAGCHNQENLAGGLNLDSYAGTIKGGKSGPLTLISKGTDCRLVKYLTGALKPQMPPGGPLKPTEIDLIRKWAEEGAKAELPNISEPKAKQPNPKSQPLPHTNAPLPSLKSGGFALKKAAPISSLLFLQDGKTLAVGTYREVQFWNSEMHQLIGKWQGHLDAVRSLSVSNDGKLIAAAGGTSGAEGETRIWEVATNREILVLKGEHSDSVNGVAFSPDGSKLVTGSSDKTIKLWDLKTGKVVATGKDHSDAVWGVAWSADGKRIASCGADKSVKIWDALSLKRLFTLSGHEDVVNSADFSPDSKSLVTASSDMTARVWSLGADSGTQIASFSGHSHSVLSAVFSANGSQIATSSADKSVRIWKTDGVLIRTLSDAKDWVYALRFSKDQSTLAAGTWSGDVLIWSLKDGKLMGLMNSLPKVQRVTDSKSPRNPVLK